MKKLRVFLEGTLDLEVDLRWGEDGQVVAECPAIPGCISQGRKRGDAIANVREAIDLCLESRADQGWTLPLRH
jgi:predicted RNase H-like HicB family nuclease